MNRLALVIIILLLFAQCKKENNKPAPDLASNMMAYYELNGQFTDSVTGTDAGYGGFLSWAKNRHGYSNRALSFNGGSFTFSTDWWRGNPLTISLWVNPKDLNSDNYMLVSSDFAFGIYQQKSRIGFVISNPDPDSAMADIKQEWTHVTGTFDGRDIKTYINGKLAKTVNHPGVPDVTSVVIVGAWQLPEWKGVLDDIRCYNRVLSAEEIRQLYELD